MRHELNERAMSVPGPGNEPASRAERSLRARLAAYALHAQRDPRETTANGRAAFLARFDREVDPEASWSPMSAAGGRSRPDAPTSLVWPWPQPRPAGPSVRWALGRGPKVEKRHDRGRLLA